MSRSKELKRRAGLYCSSVTGLERMTMRKLQSLRVSCKRLTPTNCWWAEYHLAPLLLQAIKDEFYRRARKREIEHEERKAKRRGVSITPGTTP